MGGRGASSDRGSQPRARQTTGREGLVRTALVRDPNGNLRTLREEGYGSDREFRGDLRGNGYRVLNIWPGNVSDRDVEDWEFMNRR